LWGNFLAYPLQNPSGMKNSRMLLLSFFLLLLCGQSFGEIDTKRIRFYLHRDFFSGTTASELGQRLNYYVADINSVYSKNTDIRFSFDPNNDVVLWDRPFFPFGDPGYAPCDHTSEREYGVIVSKNAPGSGSSGGTMGCYMIDGKNVIVAQWLGWSQIFSRPQLAFMTENYRAEYGFWQITAIIHEFGHTFGLGIGEYYSAGGFSDGSGVLPKLDYSYKSGFYFNTRKLVLWDPMLSTALNPTSGGIANLDTYIASLKFSPLSATIINNVIHGRYGPNCLGYKAAFCWPPNVSGSPDIHVRAVSIITGEPQRFCEVKVFAPYNYSTELLTSGFTDEEGKFSFNWAKPPSEQFSPSLHSSNNILRAVKVYCPNHEPEGDVITTFDVQAGQQMPNGGALNDFHYPGEMKISVYPFNAPPPPAVVQLNVTSVTSSSISFSWLSGGGSTDSFRITGAKGSVAQDCSLPTVGITMKGALSYTSSNLTAGSQYTYNVCALNRAGVPSPSMTIRATTLGSSPTPSPIPGGIAPPNPSGLTLSWRNSSSLSFRWTSGGGSTVGYAVAYQAGTVAPSSCSSPSIFPNSWPNSSSTTLSGLAPFSYYSIRVCARNSSGRLSSGVVLSRQTLDYSATNISNLYLSGSTRNSLTLSWSYGGFNKAGGFVYRRATGTIAPSSCTGGTSLPLSARSLTTSGMIPNTRYSFRICSKNGNGKLTSGVTFTARTRP
jgi:hypothetical protein